MRDLTELNINHGGRPVQRPPPSAADVAAFERHFGVRLPEDYLRLLRHANGGHPERDCISEPGRTDGAAWGVNHFFHLSPDRTSTRSLWWASETWRPILGDQALVFAEDGGGNAFFLDLGRDPAPVSVCIHDDNYARVPLASSFAAFIDALEMDPDAI